MTQKTTKVSVIGVGTLGTQIATQAACYGYEVKAYDKGPEIFQKVLQKLRKSVKTVKRGPTLPLKKWLEAAQKIEHCKDLAEAVKDTDLIIEACPENLELKRNVFALLDFTAPEMALQATNSSSIPFSRIEGAMKRPDKCLNIHWLWICMDHCSYGAIQILNL